MKSDVYNKRKEFINNAVDEAINKGYSAEAIWKIINVGLIKEAKLQSLHFGFIFRTIIMSPVSYFLDKLMINTIIEGVTFWYIILTLLLLMLNLGVILHIKNIIDDIIFLSEDKSYGYGTVLLERSAIQKTYTNHVHTSTKVENYLIIRFNNLFFSQQIRHYHTKFIFGQKVKVEYSKKNKNRLRIITSN